MKQALLSEPKFVSLDTASLTFAAENINSAEVKELLHLFAAGAWIPYITHHHLEEIAGYDNKETFRLRWHFLRELPNISFLKQHDEIANVGSILDLQLYEIEYLLKNPTATYDQIIEAVRPRVLGGFQTGKQFYERNFEWWDFFQDEFAAEFKRRRSEVANLTHFPSTDTSAPIDPPKDAKIRNFEEAKVAFGQMEEKLRQRIIQYGDCRNIDPAQAARNFMNECLANVTPIPNTPGEFIERMFAESGVKRDRLPENATLEDFGDEAVFVAQMGVMAKNLLVNKEELVTSIRKERLPSWVAWKAMDRILRTFPKAEIGNVIDRQIVPFGLYVNVLNVNKRIAEALRQAARNDSLLNKIHLKVPEKRGFSGLMEALR